MNNLISYNEAKIRWYKKGKFFEEEFDDKFEKDLIVFSYVNEKYIGLKNEEFNSLDSEMTVKNLIIFDSTKPEGYSLSGDFHITSPNSLNSNTVVNYRICGNWKNSTVNDLPEEIKDRIYNL